MDGELPGRAVRRLAGIAIDDIHAQSVFEQIVEPLLLGQRAFPHLLGGADCKAVKVGAGPLWESRCASGPVSTRQEKSSLRSSRDGSQGLTIQMRNAATNPTSNRYRLPSPFRVSPRIQSTDTNVQVLSASILYTQPGR
jgi:hypothetical protein